MGLNRPGFCGGGLKGSTRQDLMKRIDSLHMVHPHMGSRSLRDQLNRQGIAISRGRVEGLDAQDGHYGGVPKAQNDDSKLEAQGAPYLLCHRAITRPNEVWCAADITLHPNGQGLCLPGGGNGLGLSQSLVLEAVEHHDHGLLHRGARRGHYKLRQA